MSHTTLTLPHMNEPPRRHDVTIRVAREAGRHTDPAAFAAAASQAAAGRNASCLSAHTAEEIICVVSVPAANGPQAVAVALAVVVDALSAGDPQLSPSREGIVPAVVRGIVERRLPQLIVAGSAGDHRMAHAPAACRGFPGRPADARLPAHLRLTGPQLMTERAAFRLILEQRNGHLNDHARASRYASMITAAGYKPGSPYGAMPAPRRGQEPGRRIPIGALT